MLLLFDIDGTLLSTSGAGMRAMERAGREYFGVPETTKGIEYAGRLDTLIIRDIFRAQRREATAHEQAAFRAAYAKHLPAELAAMPPGSGVLPGVVNLLAALQNRFAQACTLGLLTGNFAETGMLKLRACGLDPEHFAVQVWGDESTSDPPTRDDLPRVGMAKHASQPGGGSGPTRTVVIGDTPWDVQCARVNGCRSLAVATGRHSLDELASAGADGVFPTLEETARVLDWLFG